VLAQKTQQRALDERTQAILAGRPPAPSAGLFKVHALEEEAALDLQQHLPQLKPREDGQVQRHYLVTITIAAHAGPDAPATMRTRPLHFLVVSENELLAQVLRRAAFVQGRLQVAIDQLGEARDMVKELVPALERAPAVNLPLLAIRAERARDTLHASATGIREAQRLCAELLRELQINRVAETRIKHLARNIVAPLNEVTGLGGSLSRVEDALQDLLDRIDIAEKGKQPRPDAAKRARELESRLKDAAEKLQQLQDAEDNAALAVLVEKLVEIERAQREIYHKLRNEQEGFRGLIDRGVIDQK
jgi:hypothetical protein